MLKINAYRPNLVRQYIEILLKCEDKNDELEKAFLENVNHTKDKELLQIKEEFELLTNIMLVYQDILSIFAV